MMSVPVELAQYVKEMQERLEDAASDPGLAVFPPPRKNVEDRIKPDARRTVFKEFTYNGDGSSMDFIEWVHTMARVEYVSEWSLSFGGDYDMCVVAMFSTTRPYTDEEREKAAMWLKNNPPELYPNYHVRWRKPVPFNNLPFDNQG